MPRCELIKSIGLTPVADAGLTVRPSRDNRGAVARSALALGVMKLLPGQAQGEALRLDGCFT